MTKLKWGTVGERFYEAGTDRGVLYLDGVGIAWNGLISVKESPSGGDPTPYYVDGVKYHNKSSVEEFSAEIEAYTYPKEFEKCDGFELLANGLQVSQQRRKEFGMSYRTQIGNDVDGISHAYKIHIIYNALTSPTNRDYKSIDDNPETATFSWKIDTRPEKFDDAFFGIMYGSHVVIDSRTIYPWALEAVENFLYGTDTVAPRLPSPTELLALFVDNALLKVTDNGDGTWSATGPDEAFVLNTKDKLVIEDITDPGLFLVQNNSLDPDPSEPGLWLLPTVGLDPDPAEAGIFTLQNGSMVEDPADPGFFVITSDITESPSDPGTYAIPLAGLVEDPNNPGLYENEMNGPWSISWPSAIWIDDEKYTISSL